MNSIRYTIRLLIKSPGFTFVALTTLALCIGATLAIFAVLDAIIVRSLPFPDPERLVVVNNAYPAIGIERGNASIQNYFERREGIDAFESVSMIRERHEIIGRTGSFQRVETAQVTSDFFQTLGVPLAMGRSFTEAEVDPGQARHVVYEAPPVAIITDHFWRNYFNADPNILGRTFLVNSGSFESAIAISVVGVLPPGFRYLSSKAQIYRPIVSTWDRTSLTRHSNMGQMVARLAPHQSIADAEAQLAVLNKRMLPGDPLGKAMEANGYHTRVASLHEDHVRSVKPVLLLLQAGVLCLLLIGAVNLAGLLLIRASVRTKEIAIRKALGASRRRMIYQSLVEALLLSLGGGALGIVLSLVGIRLLKLLGTDALPMAAEITFDGRGAVASLLVSVVVGVCIAIPIVWLNLRDQTNVQLQCESRSGTISRAVQRLRHGFIVAQIAFAFVLLCGAGMLALSLKQTLEISPGFEPGQVVTGEISVPWPDLRRGTLPHHRVLEKIQALPGVEHAAVSTVLPFTTEGSRQTRIRVEGVDLSAGDGLRAHHVTYASPEYWQTMKIPLLRGRLFDDSSWEDGVAVVDEAFAKHYWTNGDAVGRAISMHAHQDEFTPHYVIVGVVGNVKQNHLTDTVRSGIVYLPDHGGMPRFRLVVRTKVAASAMIPTVQKAVQEVDPTLPTREFTTMQSLIDETLITRRSPAILAAAFAGIALLLTSIGVYGALAFAVTQRQREIGVRMAIGGLREQIGRQFLSIGLRLLILGVLLGCLGAWATGRAIQSLLFEISPLHVPTMAGTALVMGIVILLACLHPAIRASRLDPMEALRTD